MIRCLFYSVTIIYKHLSFRQTLRLIENNRNKVTGVIFFVDQEDDLKEFGYSPEPTCPNLEFSLYKGSNYSTCESQDWNPKNPVTNILRQSWSFPIVSLVDNYPVVQKLKDKVRLKVLIFY